ncbi:unnamed protein product [Cladocopium goreaui]|uniref:Uncharacterized protein n=1 Tax=Cladocopium goreaui TaxID=2562237 RepID=A0A9P1CSF3_9DINO|nr:unnamed protein product [Cladocopium goreaui]|mmetsp:Transcript_48076/g.104833  ORF Transcript_48076/g.104833 Transcript_48076/m.104833 type:complete len:148 (-) Transcript_48076:171-614(-)
MATAVMTPRRAEQDTYDGSASPTASAARAAALAVAGPEDKPRNAEYLAPTLASLRAQEAHLASLDLFKTNIQASAASELPASSAPQKSSAEEAEEPRIIMWESEKVAMQMQKQQEEQEKKSERQIVTAVDDWFDLGAMFGCFSCREK